MTSIKATSIGIFDWIIGQRSIVEIVAYTILLSEVTGTALEQRRFSIWHTEGIT